MTSKTNLKDIPSEKRACKACKAPVTELDVHKGQVYKALGGLWHALHMTCCGCNVNVAETPFCQSPTEPGVLMCQACFLQEHAPNCAACGTRLGEKCIKADGRHFHHGCLRCTTCQLPIKGGYEVDEQTGAIYDVDCYHIMILRRDYGCDIGGA